MFKSNVLKGPYGGLDATPEIVDVTVQEANRSRGDLVAFDLSLADAAVDNLNYGSSSSGLNNVRTIDSEDLFYGTLGVIMDDVTDGQVGQVCVRGKVRAKVQKGSGDIAAGNPLYINASGYLDADASATGTKIVARAAEAVTAPSTATLAWVLFEGVYPLNLVPA